MGGDHKQELQFSNAEWRQILPVLPYGFCTIRKQGDQLFIEPYVTGQTGNSHDH